MTAADLNFDFTGLLAGKVALITGSGSGQGRAAARLMAEQGARIVVVDINDEGAGETVRMLEEDGGEGMAVHADGARRADVHELGHTGTDSSCRVDVVHHNAAVQM